jgi:transposase
MPVITLELTAQHLDELYEGLSSNDNPSARKKCLTVYLRAKGYLRDAIADIARVHPDTVTNDVQNYADSGLEGLLKDNYRQPKSQLEPHVAELKALFKKKPPTRSTKR